MRTPTIAQVTQALERSWSEETSYPKSDWTPSNPARGQCVVSTLIIQDYFGGHFKRYSATGEGVLEKHYVNLLPNGHVVDITGSQYGAGVVLEDSPPELKGFKSIREKLLADEDTMLRYGILRQRVARLLE